jgi:hypothetical protein
MVWRLILSLCSRIVWLRPKWTSPAEHLWPLVDERLANSHFDTIDDLDAIVANRCCHLHQDQQTTTSHTNFH